MFKPISEDRYENVLQALGLISRLTENRKLSVKSGDVDIDVDVKTQFFKRWWYEDDRHVCLEKVKEIFNEAVQMSRALLQVILSFPQSQKPTQAKQYLEKDRCLRKFGRLTGALENATHGIETHKVTYKDDDRFCARVVVLVDNTRDRLRDMDMSLKLSTMEEENAREQQSNNNLLPTKEKVSIIEKEKDDSDQETSEDMDIF